MVFPGWELTRAIPSDVIIGLLSGQYKLYGGVIRWAAGTENAGQIVRHLVPAGAQLLNFVPGLNFIPGIVNSLQMSELKDVVKSNTVQLTQLSSQVGSLSQSTHQVLQFATGAAALSGLGLVISCVGFVAINNKLNAIDSKLKDIQKDVQAIQQFLASSERGKLFAALDSLLKLDKTPVEHRHTILHNARQTLTEINMRYRELLSSATTIEPAMAYEEYFVLTALAQIRCTAELGMLDVAQHEIQEANGIWQTQGRRIAKEILVGEYPERFLASDFVNSVSVSEFVEWLDFANEEVKGYVWVDDLRRKLDEAWYAKSWLPMMNGGSGLNKNIGIGLEKEQTMVMPALRKLIARSNVFEGYVAQYDLLVAQNLTPSKFEQKMVALPQSSVVEGYFILEPVSAPVEQVEQAPPKRFPFQRPLRPR
ncbi:hypothetical protein H6G00_17810 [Leptolyngbya sp. FACHB-541]|uniref:hypothetical protein n=1 Tax=Leptolyngbya sp. FACHB-541 TaxID=2692810 RepID=UPI0016832A02|nr:hypothetical protein [Leptolyngbya sp. FACHB-541]MBD1998463.1 hypothetical protein [Leptolyngbya sp. FACHB-541]